jgi:hypothetical protein
VAAGEGAIVLSVFLLVCCAVFDLGLATFRYNTLGAAARRIGREATIRGVHAAPERATWGPSEYVGAADDASEYATIASTMLPTMPRGEVQIQITWLDGDNEEGSRVRVRMAYEHEPFLPFLTLGESLPLQAETSVQIAN